jgi:hypothetical protein
MRHIKKKKKLTLNDATSPEKFVAITLYYPKPIRGCMSLVAG